MRQFLESKLEKFSLNFSSCSVNLKMASTSGGGNNGKPINSGRKEIFEKYHDGKGYLKDIFEVSMVRTCESVPVSNPRDL